MAVFMREPVVLLLLLVIAVVLLVLSVLLVLPVLLVHGLSTELTMPTLVPVATSLAAVALLLNLLLEMWMWVVEVVES